MYRATPTVSSPSSLRLHSPSHLLTHHKPGSHSHLSRNTYTTTSFSSFSSLSSSTSSSFPYYIHRNHRSPTSSPSFFSFITRSMTSTATATATTATTATNTNDTTSNHHPPQQEQQTVSNNASKPKRRRQRVRRAPLKMTENAVSRIKQLLQGKGEDILGVRVGVVTKGCNGLSYTMSYAKERQTLDEEVEQDGVRLFIDNKAVMHLIGTEVDYVEDNLRAEFAFQNPNAAELCGCGKSFHPKGGGDQ